MVILGTRILAGCLSTLDNNFQVCSLDYRLKTLSECQSFNLDYGLSGDEDLSDEQVFFQAYLSPENTETFVFNFQASRFVPLQRRFFLISNKGNFSFVLPIEDAVIKEIMVMGSSSFTDSTQWLVSLVNGNKVDLLTFRTQHFIIDPATLEKGLIREGVDKFDFEDGRLILYDFERAKESLRITDVDLGDMSKKEYLLKHQVKIVQKDFLRGFIFVICENSKGQLDTYFISTDSGRIFQMSGSFFRQNTHVSLLEFDNRSFAWVFNFKGEDNSFSFKLARLNTFDSLKYFYDDKFPEKHPDLTRWTKTNQFGQEYQTCSVEFLDQRERLLTLEVRIVPDDFVIKEFDRENIELRVQDVATVYLPIFGNNLGFDLHDMDFLYFNELEYNLDFLLKELGTDSIAFVCYHNDLSFFTMEGRLVHVGVRRGSFNRVKKVKRFKTLQVHGLFSDKIFEIDQLEYSVIQNTFLVILINERRLFYCDIDQIMAQTTEIRFYELDIPEGFICRLRGMLVVCSKRKTNIPKKYFFNFKIIDRILALTEITTLLPDDSSALFPFSYFLKMFSQSDFINLTLSVAGKVAIVESNQKKVLNVYNLPFLTKEDAGFVYFSQLIKNVHLIVVHRERLGIWVVKGHMKLYFPCQEHLVEFDSYVGTYSKPNNTLFAVVYRTLAGSLRAVVYQLNLNSINRVINEMLLDKEGCPDDQITLSFGTSQKTTYMFYVCRPTRNIRVFKYTGYNHLNLVVREDRDQYILNASRVPEMIFKVSQPKYSVVSSVEVSDIILTEEDSLQETKDLEESAGLELEGDIIRACPVNLSAGLRFKERIQLTNSNFIGHENKIKSLDGVRLFEDAASGQIGFVTNEFIMKGPDIQNNNFYEECAKPKVLITNDNDKWYRGLFLCQNKENKEFVLTDFLKVRLKVALQVGTPQSVFLAKIHGLLYIFVNPRNFYGIEVFKFKVQGKTQGELPLLEAKSIFFDEITSPFANTEFFHIVYVFKTNSLYFFRKRLHSNYFSVSRFSLIENVFDLKSTQIFQFPVDEGKLVYVRYT